MWTRAHLVGFAVVVHRCDANVRALVLLRHAEMILDDFRFWMPDSDNVGDMRILFLDANGFTADGRFFESKLLVKPVDDVWKSGNRVNLVDV